MITPLVPFPHPPQLAEITEADQEQPESKEPPSASPNRNTEAGKHSLQRHTHTHNKSSVIRHMCSFPNTHDEMTDT